jgi:leucyl-tRNA synthetase
MAQRHDVLPDRYHADEVEVRWQRVWADQRTFMGATVSRDGTRATPPDRPKSYVLEMLPYPSGEIHMGHVKN